MEHGKGGAGDQDGAPSSNEVKAQKGKDYHGWTKDDADASTRAWKFKNIMHYSRYRDPREQEDEDEGANEATDDAHDHLNWRDRYLQRWTWYILLRFTCIPLFH